MAFGVLRQSGGSLLIESEEGKGTRITLLLKLSTSEPARVIGEVASANTRIDLHGRVVALVDDDDQVRVALADTLMLAGATVAQGANGNEAIDLVRDASPELLIVDFAMPGMSGAEVIRRVRETNPGLPVLLITGFADSATLDAVMGPEVVMLRKPFESRELLRRVSELLGN
jgi:CheY-like chemotaxis protein